MTSGANVVGIEILVFRLTEAVAFFEEILGWSLAYEGPADHAPGRVAVFDAGSIAVTLFEPDPDRAETIADTTPRVTQLVVGDRGDEVDALVESIRSGGLPVEHSAADPFIPPAAAAGVVGFPIAISMRPIPTE